MKRIASVIPHGVIVISLMYQTFFVIDIINTAMHFIDSVYSIRLFAIYSALLILEAIVYVVMLLKRSENRALLVIPVFLFIAALSIISFIIYNEVDPRRLLFSDRSIKIAIFVFSVIINISSFFLIAAQRSIARRAYEREAAKASAASVEEE